jgi:hypothetical protein
MLLHDEQEEWDIFNFSSFYGNSKLPLSCQQSQQGKYHRKPHSIFEWVIGECVRCTCTKYRSDQQNYWREKLNSLYFVTTNLIKYKISNLEFLIHYVMDPYYCRIDFVDFIYNSILESIISQIKISRLFIFSRLRYHDDSLDALRLSLNGYSII